MKIALVHRRFTTNGGAERYLVGLARFLVRQGHEVVVLVNEIRPDLAEEPGVRFVHLPMLRWGAIGKLVSLWVSASRALGREPFEVIMGIGRTGGNHVFRAGGGSHVDALRRMHPWRRWLSPDDWVEMWLDRRAVLDARICIANSELGARGMRDDYGARRVEVVYNGVDGVRFRPDPQRRAEVRERLGAVGPVALFLGNGWRRKGLAAAIEAVQPPWTLWVAGGDRPWEAPRHVRFVGHQGAPETLLPGADVFVLPTRYDPFANACLEAMSCGVPALTTSANGVAEVLPEPWMVADDVAGLRAGLDRLLDVDERVRVAERCREVAARLTPERSYARALELLEEAVRLAGAPR